MEKRQKFDLTRILAGAALFVSVQGCAFFTGKADYPNLPPDLAGTTQNVPLPVEVARDIATIANGGTVAPVNPPMPSIFSPQELKAKAEARARAQTDDGEDDVGCNCAAEHQHPPKSKRETSSTGKVTVYKTPAKTGGGPKAKRKPGSNEDYTVKGGDTLMKISFEKFGNVYRWREIYNENRDRIPDYNQLVEGTMLKIKGVEYVVIERNGLPYLIRRNDTLVKISRGIYGTPKKWTHLWQNNRQLIHDPNKIYAGFTLYYQPDGVTKPAISNLKGPLRSRIPAANRAKK